MMMAFLFDSGEVLEVLEVLVANKEDEIHLAVDQKQPHAERVLQFIFLHINTIYTLGHTCVMNWDSRNPCVQQIQEFHGSNIHRYFCSPKNIGLLLRKIKIFYLHKWKEPSKIQLIHYFQAQKMIYMNFFIINPL